MAKSTLPARKRVSELLTLGVLADYVPMDDVRAVLAHGYSKEKRKRDLHMELMMLYVVAMALHRNVSCQEVLRILLERFRWLVPAGSKIAVKSSITDARVRLGKVSMRLLFERLARPIATPATLGSWFKTWLTVAFDGSTFTLADTPENVAAFGYPGDASVSSFPIMRCLGLAETGVHAMFACAMGPYAVGEGELALRLLGSLKPGMLLLTDRNFLSFGLWKACCATGADLVWRVTSRWNLKPVEILSDGSWLSKIRSPRGSGSKEEILVRVVRYEVEGSKESYRLVTTILDPEKASAQELSELYHERWEIEGVFDEIKTHLRGPRTTFRSKTPELVEQEFWGLMIAHRALRSLMHEAALKHKLDPDEVSFTHTVNVVKRTLPTGGFFSPSDVTQVERDDSRRTVPGQEFQQPRQIQPAKGETPPIQIRYSPPSQAAV